MTSRRCVVCGIYWLDDPAYRSCPECGHATTWRNHEPDFDRDEAASRARHAEFARYYAEREAQREKRGEPTPEQLGALEAQRQVDALRELDAQLEGPVCG